MSKEKTVLPAALVFSELQKTHGEKAAEVYHAISRIGGFGDFGADFLNGLPVLALESLPAETSEQIERREQIAAILKVEVKK
jgi:hypothetical protein